MADIFLSYAREDRERAQVIAKTLEDHDWTVWWDPQIPPGKTFDHVIETAIKEAKCVVVLWSKNSVKSDWVKEEATIAKRRGILVPATLDDVAPPMGFGLIQAADLTDWKSQTDHLAYAGLIESISEILGVKTRDLPRTSTENEIIRRVRTQMLASKSSRELRKNMYDLEQHLVRNPNSPDARLLRDEIQSAIKRAEYFEREPSPRTPRARRIMSPWLIGSTLAVTVVALIIVLYGKLGSVPPASQAKKQITLQISKIESQLKQLEHEIESTQKEEDLANLYREQEALSVEVADLREKAINAGLVSQINDLQARIQAVSQKLETKAKQLENKAPTSLKNSIDMEFVLIPAGTFMMGGKLSPEEVVQKNDGKVEWYEAEHPQHNVTISEPFYLQSTEVTQVQWKKVMDVNPSIFKNCGDDCPVESVTWDDAQKFIKKLNEMEDTERYRLPSEAEWEYAG